MASSKQFKTIKSMNLDPYALVEQLYIGFTFNSWNSIREGSQGASPTWLPVKKSIGSTNYVHLWSGLGCFIKWLGKLLRWYSVGNVSGKIR
jgi:hypothetical protein